MTNKKNKKKQYWISLLICILIITAILFGINGGYFNANKNSKNLTITTSFYPLYFFTSQITGDKANVINITPSGSEPHDYEPTPNNIIDIQKSKLLVLNGANFETWGNKIKDQLNNTDIQIITVGNNIINQNYTDKSGNPTSDPHIWLDPKLAKKEAAIIEQAIVQIDPINETFYQNNLNKLNNKLDELDSEFKSGLAFCQQKNIVTSHAAFGYLAKSYGLNQVSITGISPDSEPSPSQLADITEFVRKNNVKYIFFESLASPKLAQTIANETGAKTISLNPIEGLTPDNQKNNLDYISIMNDNLNNLRKALQCK